MPQHAGVVTRGRALQPVLDALGVIQEPNARFEFLETIIPVAIVDVPSAARTVVTRRYNGFSTFMGAVAERANLQIFNPTDSGVLVRIERCVPTSAVTGTLRLKTTSVPLATLDKTNQGAMDFRTPGVGAAELREESFVFGAEPGFMKGQFVNIAGVTFPQVVGDRFLNGYVLTPTSGLILVAATDNTALTVYWEWFEEVSTTQTQ